MRASNLEALIHDTPRFRRLFDPDRDGGRKYVVSGIPAAWNDAEKALSRAGGSVVAFHDIRGDQPSRHRDRPVMRGRLDDKLDGATVVFAGKPNKSWFNPSPPGPQRCLWMVPPVQWQQSGRHTPQLWTEQRPQIERVFDLLADQPSRQILASIVKARIEGDTGFHRISPFQEYDHPVVHAGRGDVVVDVGAYDGDSAELYAQRVGPGGRVVAMEPSPANYGKMIQRMRQQRLENITPLLLGAWNDDAVLRFEDGAGVSSKLGSEGKTQVVVTPIDRLVGDYRLPRVDLIKLDVEGAEKAALEGARDTILRFRPQLHISIYHRFDDIFELPLMLAEWLPRYRWYMGHHSYYQMETDLYGVPVERWMRRRVWRVGRKLLRQAGRRFTRQSPSAPDKALSGGA